MSKDRQETEQALRLKFKKSRPFPNSSSSRKTAPKPTTTMTENRYLKAKRTMTILFFGTLGLLSVAVLTKLVIDFIIHV